MTPGHRRDGAEQELRRQARRAGRLDPGRGGPDLRVPRPQRLGQDHHPAHALRPADAGLAARARCWASTSAAQADAIKRADRLHDPAVLALRGPDHRGEPGVHRPRLRPRPTARERVDDGAGAAGPGQPRATSWPARCRAAGSSGWRWPPATLHEPQLLLLDEPTAGVDPKARRDFWDEIHALAAEGLTVLVSTHYMDEAERCHDIAYIAYGKLIARGTAEEVVEAVRPGHLPRRGPGRRPARRASSQASPASRRRAPFGAALHVSGTDRAALEAARSRPTASAPLPLDARSSRRWRTCSSS